MSTTKLNVMALGIVIRGIVVCACVAGTVYLAIHDKQGWGWLIFIAIISASTSFKYVKD